MPLLLFIYYFHKYSNNYDNFGYLILSEIFLFYFHKDYLFFTFFNEIALTSIISQLDIGLLFLIFLYRIIVIKSLLQFKKIIFLNLVIRSHAKYLE
jgi:hypothetical protein